jgi:hypothetical protein
MGDLSRRTFLTRTGAAVAVAGVVTSVPIAAKFASADADDLETAGALDTAASLSEPIVAHVRNLKTGEISLFSGTRHVTVHDPRLAARLVRASR